MSKKVTYTLPGLPTKRFTGKGGTLSIIQAESVTANEEVNFALEPNLHRQERITPMWFRTHDTQLGFECSKGPFTNDVS